MIRRRPSAVLLLASPSVTEFMRRLDGLGLPGLAVATAVEGYRSLVSEVVAISESTARLAADTARQATARLPLTDCLIAAAARERQACLVHRDSHYLSIPAAVLTQRDIAC